MTNVQEQDKRKGGRPPTGRVRKLSKSVTVKFSKPSYEALRLRARKANRKLAEYIRESALNGEVLGVEEPPECYMAYTTEKAEKEALKIGRASCRERV